MGLYNQPTADLVWRQINRDNPQLPYPLSADNAVLLQGPLTTNLGSSGRNTRAVFNGIAGKGYKGKIEVFYDRLPMASLFNNFTPTVTIPYLATTRAQMLPAVNAALGLGLKAEDILNPDVTAYASSIPTALVTFMMDKTKNLAFTGNLSVTTVRDDPSFADIYLNTAVNVWDDISVYSRVWRKSFHPYTSQLAGVPSNTKLKSNLTGVAAFLNAIRNWTGIPFTCGTTLSNDPFDITDAIVTQAATTLRPDANQNYKNVYVLTPAAGSRWQMPFYFHFNPRDKTEVVKASYQDFLNFLAMNPNYAEVPASALAGAYLNRSIVYSVGGTLQGHRMGGTSWFSTFQLSTTYISRAIQHAFPIQAQYDDAFMSNRKVIFQLSGQVSASSYVATNRNGYASLSGGGGDGAYGVSFVFYDPVDGCMKRTVPLNNNTATNWLP